MLKGYYPIDARELPPEFLWVFAVISVLVLAVIIVFVLFAQRRYAAEPPRIVPPIPMAADYDESLTAADRLQELLWLRELMDSPSYGESDQRPPS